MNATRRIVLAMAWCLLPGCLAKPSPAARGGPDDPVAAAAPLPELSATLAVSDERPSARMPQTTPTQPAPHDHAGHGETAVPTPAGGHEHAH